MDKPVSSESGGNRISRYRTHVSQEKKKKRTASSTSVLRGCNSINYGFRN